MKKIVCVLVSFVLALSMAACTVQSKPSATPQEEKAPLPAQAESDNSQKVSDELASKIEITDSLLDEALESVDHNHYYNERTGEYEFSVHIFGSTEMASLGTLQNVCDALDGSSASTHEFLGIDVVGRIYDSDVVVYESRNGIGKFMVDGAASSAPSSSGATMGERNALESAKSYLKYSAFSYSGLIDQLEYEGYSTSEATYAVDHCGADWNEQAVLSAASYLKYSSFSKQGLIEQLEYEGFTHDQAVYGVEHNGY